MIYLAGSIVLTSYLTFALKICGRYRIALFPAIIFNYFTCVITGSIVNGSFPIDAAAVQTPWFKWACVMGVMFISIFNLFGITTQKNGVAVASVANKVSLVIPVLLSLYLYHESVTAWQVAGILLALLAVVMSCYPREGADGREKQAGKQLLLPVLLFFGSGLLDALINHVQQLYVTDGNKNAYLISGFFSAGCIGIVILTTAYLTGKIAFSFKQVLAGICIGIPNYFSIWCLVRFLKISPWQSSASIPVNNMGIVLFSTLVAWLLFRERLAKVNWLGIGLSVIAIYLIAFGNKL